MKSASWANRHTQKVKQTRETHNVNRILKIRKDQLVIKVPSKSAAGHNLSEYSFIVNDTQMRVNVLQNIQFGSKAA